MSFSSLGSPRLKTEMEMEMNYNHMPDMMLSEDQQ